MGQHHLADQRVGQVTACIDDDHVAGARHIDGLMQHQVIARARPDRQRDPGHATRRVHRPKA